MIRKHYMNYFDFKPDPDITGCLEFTSGFGKVSFLISTSKTSCSEIVIFLIGKGGIYNCELVKKTIKLFKKPLTKELIESMGRIAIQKHKEVLEHGEFLEE